MRSVRKSACGAIASAVALLLMTGCGDDKDAAKSPSSSAPAAAPSSSAAPAPAPSSTAPAVAPSSTAPAPEPVAENVKLTVAGLRPGSEKAAQDALDAQIKDFESKNPTIDIDAKEYAWNGVTFQAQLAGGQVPTVLTIPFTDGGALIQRQQISDISEDLKALPYAGNFNPAILKYGQDGAGKIYAVPTAAYANGLHYNRKLFEEAGLDPNKPPTTWDEVRSFAKQITEKTGKPGYVQMTKDNTGGWMLTNLTAALGGRMEKLEGDHAVATVNNEQAKKALQLLKDMRWTDKSMGANFLLNWPDINAEFSAGKVGMYTQGADVYTYLAQNTKVDPATYGLAPMPFGDGPEPGVLGGGTLAAVKAGASPAERAAAVKWIDYYYLSKLTNEEAAITDAKALAANKQPIGTPALPIFDQAQLDKSLGWIKEFINVPLDQMKPFTDAIASQPLAAEPPVATQAVYGLLDPVVQAVLTKQDANINELLDKANVEAQKAIDKAEAEAKG